MLTPTARHLGFAIGLIVATAGGPILTPSPARAADPPKLAGTWVWTWKDRIGQTHRHTLEVEGLGAKLAARELFDDQPAVAATNLALDGASIRFTVVREGRKADYVGKVVDDDHIDGTVTVTSDGQGQEFPWKAERRKVVPK